MIISDCSITIKSGQIVTESKPVIESHEFSMTVYLDGILYNTDLDQLLDICTDPELSLIHTIDGLFSLFIIRANQVQVITDRVNSRKVFIYQNNHDCIMTNDINYFARNDFPLTIDGIACYIVNGCFYNGLTLFESVKSLNKASILSVQELQITVKSYWEFILSETNEQRNQKLKNELITAFNKSCTERMPDTHLKKALSLSAGFDARTLLLVLSRLQPENFSTFSYTAPNPTPNSDAVLSRKLAEQFNVNHLEYTTGGSEFMDYLTKNVMIGKCITRFNFEVNAWLEMSKNYPVHIYTGDEVFGWSDHPLHSPGDILDTLYISNERTITYLKPYLSKDQYIQFKQSIQKLNKKILKRADHLQHLHLKKDFLYLDQRVTGVIMPFRDSFSRMSGHVHIPFLSNQIIDIVSKLGIDERLGKKFFKESIKSEYPELFQIPLASTSHQKKDWTREIQKHKNEIFHYLNHQTSSLDLYLKPDQIKKMIHQGYARKNKFYYLLYRINHKFRRKYSIYNQICNLFGFPRVKLEPIEQYIIRILMLRIYLNDDKRSLKSK